MDLHSILEELYERRRCIQVAIEALEWAEKDQRRGPRPDWLRERPPAEQREKSGR
jgi:hypothetical protein